MGKFEKRVKLGSATLRDISESLKEVTEGVAIVETAVVAGGAVED